MTTKPSVVSDITRRQIEELPIGGRPLVICDVDEVLLSFIAPLETHLDRLGYALSVRSYKLVGNITRRDTGAALDAAEVHALINGFFAESTHLQRPVAGASEALDALSGTADVVLLTNIPAEYRDDRIATLSRCAIRQPVVTNTGPKGEAAALIAQRAGAPVVFLDDSPSNLVSVRDAVAACRIVQFVADPRFLALAPEIDGVALRTGDWREARRFIHTVLAEPVAGG